jgi:hypothetical protein
MILFYNNKKENPIRSVLILLHQEIFDPPEKNNKNQKIQ